MTNTRKASYGVLIVDDSENDRFLIRRVIGRFSRFHIVGEACDGEQAIAYLSAQGPDSKKAGRLFPDLVLLDLRMPGMSGFEVLQWIRARPFPNLTVIVLSGSLLQDDVGASLAFGAHGYWTKTASREKQIEIAREIQALMDRRCASNSAA